MLLGRLFACHKSDNIIKNSVSGKMLRPTCHLQLESPLLSQGGPSVAIVINIEEASRSNCVFVFIKFCWLKPLIISSVDTENIIIVCTSMLNWGGGDSSLCPWVKILHILAIDFAFLDKNLTTKLLNWGNSCWVADFKLVKSSKFQNDLFRN